MALVIQTNNAAVTAQKNINTNVLGQNKALNRLSSGFRINSAADDAAGFAISSKLDAQGSRLKAAVQNASQATALVKTAEAGVNEIQNMVVRLQTLAIQAASANNAGSLTQLDAERSKLTAEIDKIANSTNFNGTNLLNGINANSAAVAGNAANAATVSTAGGGVVTGSVTASNVYDNQVFTVTTTAGTAAANGTKATVANANATATAGNTGNGTMAIVGTGANFSVAATTLFTVNMTGATTFGVTADHDLVNITDGSTIATGSNVTAANSGLTFTLTAGGTAMVSGDKFTFSTTANGTAYQAATAGQITSVTSTKDLLDSNSAVTATAGTNLLTGGTAVARASSAGTVTLTLKTPATGSAATLAFTDVAAGAGQTVGTFEVTTTGSTTTAAGTADYTGALSFQVGAENNANNQVDVKLQNKYTLAGLSISGDVSTAANAKTYIDTLKSALDTLVTQRADLGASANQLGFVQANLATSIEQVSASVSSIRDANIAVEIANFTKSQILVQAGTAMLAQANQASKNVLRLFQ